ncbi:MAG: tetratricopeptide repeat protein [Bacteroidota bacterium]
MMRKADFSLQSHKNRKLCLLVIFLSSSLLVNTLSAQDPDRQFYTANQSYEIGEYAVAIEQYEILRSEDYHSAELYYNLANAYYRFGELGKAILNYERALRLAPEDEDILHNLSLAKEEVDLKLDQLPTFFLTAWKRNLEDAIATNVWTTLFLLFLWLTFGALILWQIGKKRSQRKWGFVAALCLGIIAVAGFFLASGSYQTENESGVAIVLEEIPMRKGANAASPEVIQLKEGIKVKLLKTVIQDWQKVRLSNGQEGWLPIEVVEKV